MLLFVSLFDCYMIKIQIYKNSNLISFKASNFAKITVVSVADIVQLNQESLFIMGVHGFTLIPPCHK